MNQSNEKSESRDALRKEKRMENLRRAAEEEKRMGRTVADCPFRTKFHIMPPVGWINDPNGLCQFRGVFHAYFQYSPLSVHGGGGYWGHCTSKDLLRWEYHEPVLTSDIPEDQSGVYSGSALIEDGKMYLFYTGNVKRPGDYDYIDKGRISTQLMVSSEDGQHMSEKKKLLGMEDYPADITAHVRDPKVWKEGDVYYMILGARARGREKNGTRRDRGGVLIYASEEMENWGLYREIVPEDAFGYMWECPDLFELNGERILSYCPQGLEHEKERFQNIYQSGYSVLTQAEDPAASFTEWDMGFDFYAPQTFLSEDGRRILIGWSGRTVLLEVSGIAGGAQEIRFGKEGNALNIRAQDDLAEISFLDRDGRPSECGGGRGRRIGRLSGPIRELTVLADSSVIEVFINGGEMTFTTRIYLDKDERELSVSGPGTYSLSVVRRRNR